MKKYLCLLLFLLSSILQHKAQNLSTTVLEQMPSQLWTLSITLQEAKPISALQIDILLPQGISILETQKGNLLSPTHQLHSSNPTKNLYHLIIYSSDNKTFNKEKGTVAVLTLSSGERPTQQSHTLILKNILLSDATGNEIAQAQQTLTLPNSQQTALHTPNSETNREKHPIYTLQGKRVSQPLIPGIYIQGGRKLILK